jgi:hypothetical protein
MPRGHGEPMSTDATPTTDDGDDGARATAKTTGATAR